MIFIVDDMLFFINFATYNEDTEKYQVYDI